MKGGGAGLVAPAAREKDESALSASSSQTRGRMPRRIFLWMRAVIVPLSTMSPPQITGSTVLLEWHNPGF